MTQLKRTGTPAFSNASTPDTVRPKVPGARVIASEVSASPLCSDTKQSVRPASRILSANPGRENWIALVSNVSAR